MSTSWEYEDEEIVPTQAGIAIIMNGDGIVEICQRLPNGTAVRIEIIGKENLGRVLDKIAELHSNWGEEP